MLIAAKKVAIDYYKRLNKIIPELSYIGQLAEESSNVLSLVKSGYYDVVKNIKFTASASDNVDVTFNTDCSKEEFGGGWKKSAVCDNVVEGQEYTFNVTMELKKLNPSKKVSCVLLKTLISFVNSG